MRRLLLAAAVLLAVAAVLTMGAVTSRRDPQAHAWRPLMPVYDDGYVSYLPLQRTWTDSGYEVHDGTGIFQPCLVYQDGVYYCFYERDTGTAEWEICVAYTTDLGGTWTDVQALLEPTGVPGEPDEADVADPTVLYIPWSPRPWHMWFDMNGDTGGDTEWTIGHATAAAEPHIPASWTKDNTAGVTDVVLDMGSGTAFEGYDNSRLHCPEAFIWGGAVHLLYGCIGSAHSNYDTMLAIANDSHGLGYVFEKWGVAIDDDTLSQSGVGGDRVSSVLAYDGVLYACVFTSSTNNYWVCSTDGGKSWREFGEQPTGGDTDGFHSFIVVQDRVWAVTQGNADLYYLDIRQPSGSVSGTRNDDGDRTNLQYMDNVYRGYFIGGEPAILAQPEDTQNLLTMQGTIADLGGGLEVKGLEMDWTGAGTLAYSQNGLRVNMLPGFTGTGRTRAIQAVNTSLNTYAVGIRGESSGDHANTNRGVEAYADNDTGVAVALHAELDDGADGSSAGYFTDGTRTVELCEDGDTAIRAIGAPIVLQAASTHGGLTLSTYSASSGTLTADHTITIQVDVPSGALIVGTQLHVKTALAGGETWNAQYVTGATQAIAAAAAVAQNTNVNTFFDANGATAIASDEVDITLQRSSNPGVDAFTAQGEIEAVVYAYSMDAWSAE